MNDSDKLAAAVEENCRKERWEQIGAQRDGAVMLEDLLHMLDEATEFRFRHDVVFDMSPVDEERAVLISYRGLRVGKWTRDGRVLKLCAVHEGGPEPFEVTTTKIAFETTVHFVINVLRKLPKDWPRRPLQAQPTELPPPPPQPTFGFITPRD